MELSLTEDVQEAPFGEAEDNVDYIRSGNVKLNTQALKIRYQEEGHVAKFYEKLTLIKITSTE